MSCQQRGWWLVCAVWLTMGGTAASVRAEVRPILVLGVAPPAQWSELGTQWGELAGQPRLTQSAQRLLARWTGMSSARGLNRQRPMGLILAHEELLIAPVVFLPADDGQVLLQSLRPLLGSCQPNGTGAYDIGSGALTGVAVEKDGWLRLAQSPEALALTIDPRWLAESAPRDAIVWLRLHVQNIPPVLRDFAIDHSALALEQLEHELGSQANEADAQRLEWARWKHAALVRFFEEVDRVELRLVWRPPQRAIDLEATVVPLEDSPLSHEAAGLAAVGRTTATFARDALLDVVLAAPLDQPTRGVLRQQLLPEVRRRCPILAAEDASDRQRWVDTWWQLMQQAADGSALQLRVRAYGSPRRPTYVLSARVEDGAAWLAQRRAQSGARWQTAIAEHDGVTIDALNLPDEGQLPADDQPEDRQQRTAPPSGGNRVKRMLVARQDHRVYVAVGPDDLARLRAALHSEWPEAVLGASVRLSAALSQVTFPEENAALRAGWTLLQAALAAGDDRVEVRLSAEEGNFRLRLTAREGLLRGAAAVLVVAESIWPPRAPNRLPPEQSD